MTIKNTAIFPKPEWLMGGNPDAIERQEAEGQQQLAKSSQLPTDGLADVAAALGIRVLCESPNDALFSDVELSTGWRIQPTSHAMWSDLLDDQGVKRAAIFYKAAFYDRSAFIRLED